ncbi:LysM peptidoglycan-binding domain-containing protein [Peribacillus sp. NPDC096540]|uniref:LysM peptidoglycan-binding domain-containing protein n=1 Tax=Peribacillus sp. NPDC096540 TaxID=3390612 RepID=UPI003CFD38A1
MNDVKKSGKDKDQAGELGTRVERQKSKSSLPKRSQIHQNKKKKSKVKIKFPMIKLLSLFFILLPFGIYSLYTYLQERPEHDTRSDQVVNYNNSEDAGKETIPTTATADDLKDNDLEKEEKNSPKSEAEKKKEKQNAEEKEQAKKKAEEKEKAQQEAEEKAKAKQIAEEKAQQEAEEKAKAKQIAEEKAQQEAKEKAKAKQIAEEKAKKEAAEDKKTAERALAVKPNKDEYKVVLHTVKAEETLFRISMNYYKSQEGIALIKEWNGLNGNEISKGQVLKIPIKK